MSCLNHADVVLPLPGCSRPPPVVHEATIWSAGMCFPRNVKPSPGHVPKFMTKRGRSYLSHWISKRSTRYSQNLRNTRKSGISLVSTPKPLDLASGIKTFSISDTKASCAVPFVILRAVAGLPETNFLGRFDHKRPPALDRYSLELVYPSPILKRLAGYGLFLHPDRHNRT